MSNKTFKAMKFKVSTVEESEALQNYLFSLGYKWSGEVDEKAARNSTHPFLYSEPDGYITYSDSKFGETFFNKQTNHKEMVVEFKTTTVVSKITHIKPRTIEIDGVEYEVADIKLNISPYKVQV